MRKPKQRTSIAQLRAKIDLVDTALLNLIAERMELASAVRHAKSGINVWRPSREESHVRHLAEMAGETPPELVSRIWAELTSASLALQGPIQLHIALGGEGALDGEAVRDRFGASIPMKKYPTASAALAAAKADPEGVAILPAPGGMNNWWTALGPDGAASDMHILAALPRIGDWDWPCAVAVSKAALESSGNDRTLVYVNLQGLAPLKTTLNVFSAAGADDAVLRAELGDQRLYSTRKKLDPEGKHFVPLRRELAHVKIVGLLPDPIALSA